MSGRHDHFLEVFSLLENQCNLEERVMGGSFHLTKHALRRINESSRSVLFQDEILEILERGEFLVLYDNTQDKHLLFYSPEDKEHYVLAVVKGSGAVKTILPKHMYSRLITVSMQKQAVLQSLPLIYVWAEMKVISSNKRRGTIPIQLGHVNPVVRVRDLAEWVTHPLTRTQLQKLLEPHLTSKYRCMNLFISIGQKKLKNADLTIPWS